MVRRQEITCLFLARGGALFALVFALVAMVLLFFPTLAAAHAVLVSSTPAQNERLLAVPKALSLRFSEAVTRIDATLVSREGVQRKLKTVVTGGDVSSKLPGPLADGAYAFTWRIVSGDGHPVSGSVVFSIGKGSKLTDFSAVTSNAGWIATATWGAKFVFYCATLFGVGGVFFSVVIARERPRRVTTSRVLFELVLASEKRNTHRSQVQTAYVMSRCGSSVAIGPWRDPRTVALGRRPDGS
jgi:copper transport protein